MTTCILVVVPIVICIIISYFSTSLLYKIVFLALGIFIATTLGLAYINILLRDNIDKSKMALKTQNNNSSKQNKPNSHKPKVVNNQDYDELIQLLKYCMKNKLLDRQQILDFKNVLNEHLGSHKESYSNFNFKNDLHEIYVKSKNNVLTSKDYKELKMVLENYKIN